MKNKNYIDKGGKGKDKEGQCLENEGSKGEKRKENEWERR